jgi:fluoroacetyl-CoA thioesterase
MKNPFVPGDKKQYHRLVAEEDTAAFESGTVHAVYGTFALTRDAEWAGRLFVLDMKEEHEEGIGTFVEVQHIGPAFVGEEVVLEATLQSFAGNKVTCGFTAKVGERMVATGRTGQKILDKEKLKQYFAVIKNGTKSN